MTTQPSFDRSYRVLARSLLGRATGFDRCPTSVLDCLVDNGQLVRLATGDIFIRRGEPSDCLVMVVEGALEATITKTDGQRHFLTFVLPGTLFGLLSLIDDGPLPHDTAAHMPTVVLKTPGAVIRRQLALSLPLHFALEQQMALRLRFVYDGLAETILFSLHDRLAKQLVSLVEQIGRKREGYWTIDLKLPQSDLADLLGASRQSVNTELRAMQEAGLLRIARSRIDILDLEGMRERRPLGIENAIPRRLGG
jgi:CRP/FNR family cyclic AMP-dependent transcriptional regulator